MNFEQKPTINELTHSSTQEIEPKNPNRLRNIGKKAWDLSYLATVSGGSIFGMAHTLNPNLPPHYSIGGSFIAGIAVSKGADKIRDHLNERKSKKNPPTDHEITDTDTQVV